MSNDNDNIVEVGVQQQKKALPVTDFESLTETVEVLGAGQIVVNGVYTRHKNQECFCKQGFWDGHSVELRLFREIEGNFSSWYIEKAVNDDDDDGDDGFPWAIRFYKSVVCHDNDNVTEQAGPPRQCWTVCNRGDDEEECTLDEDLKGLEPVPIILYGDEVPRDWRFGANKSMSDWTIRICLSEKGHDDQKDYHVHRIVITTGERSSGYFRHVSGLETCLEHNSKTSTIDLHPIAAMQFPVLLDYLYDQPLRIETRNAIALLSLAQYFDCSKMLHEVNRFIVESSTFNPEYRHVACNNCAHFYEPAIALGMHDIVEKVEEYCVQNFDQMLPHDEIFIVVPVSFCLSVLSKVVMTRRKQSRIASVWIAEVCRNHGDEIDRATFLQLTEKLTHISYIVAVEFLRLDMYFHGGADDANSEELTRLHLLCLQSIADSLGEVDHFGFIQLPEGCSAVLYARLWAMAHASVKRRLRSGRLAAGRGDVMG